MGRPVVHYVPGTLITFTMEPGVVHIDNDSALKNSSLNSWDIASEIKAKYKSVYGVKLDITTNSMAIEIEGHVFPDKMARYVKSLPGVPDFVVDFCTDVLERTEVIDIGESNKDSNRWVWDLLDDLMTAPIFL